MSETSLEDLLSDKELDPVEPEPKTTGDDPEPEPKEPADPEPKDPAEPAEPKEPNDPSEPPSPKASETDEEPWTKKAVLDERRKRQELEARLKELESKKPPEEEADWYSKPEEAAQRQQAQFSQALWNQRVELSQDMMRERHEDYDDMEARFVQMAQENPTLRAEFQKAPNPARFAYDTAKKAAEYEAMKDVDGYKAKLEAEMRKELEEKVRAEYEAKAKKQAEKEAAIEPSLASAGNGGLKSSDWSGPTPLDDILK